MRPSGREEPARTALTGGRGHDQLRRQAGSRSTSAASPPMRSASISSASASCSRCRCIPAILAVLITGAAPQVSSFQAASNPAAAGWPLFFLTLGQFLASTLSNALIVLAAFDTKIGRPMRIGVYVQRALSNLLTIIILSIAIGLMVGIPVRHRRHGARFCRDRHHRRHRAAPSSSGSGSSSPPLFLVVVFTLRPGRSSSRGWGSEGSAEPGGSPPIIAGRWPGRCWSSSSFWR